MLHNGARAELILTFDNEHPGGYVAGVQSVYLDGETDTVAKSLFKIWRNARQAQIFLLGKAI